VEAAADADVVKDTVDASGDVAVADSVTPDEVMHLVDAGGGGRHRSRTSLAPRRQDGGATASRPDEVVCRSCCELRRDERQPAARSFRSRTSPRDRQGIRRPPTGRSDATRRDPHLHQGIMCG